MLRTTAKYFALSLIAATAYAAPSASDTFAKLPLRFEQDSHLRWTAKAAGAAFLFAGDQTVARVGKRGFGLRFEGSNTQAPFVPEHVFSAPTNHFTAAGDRVTSSYARLRRNAVYPGIDVVYYGNGRQLEYDFNLAPGADPSRIRLSFEGTDRVSVNAQGDIVLTLGAGEVVQKAPVVYQRRESGEIVTVPSGYVMRADGSIGVRLSSYDKTKPVTIDPVIVYTAFLSGSDADYVTTIARDARGYIYLGGYTYSSDFPFGPVSYDFIFNFAQDAFVMVLDPFASSADGQVKYTTYIGGSSDETLSGLALDRDGNICVTGSTSSGDLPLTSSAYKSTLASGTHVYVAVVDPRVNGNAGLKYASFYGGTKLDVPTGLATNAGKVYVAGWTLSDDLPTRGAYQGSRAGSSDGFVAVFDPSLSGDASLNAATYFGGTKQEVLRTIAVDATGKVYVAGVTYSTDYPLTAGAANPVYGGAGDIFVAKLDIEGASLLYSTYLGGSGYEEAKKLIVEPSGRVAITGYTLSDNYPVTANAAQAVYRGNGDAFVTVLDMNAASANLAVVYSTLFGGTDGDVAYDLRRDAAGRYVIAGYTLSLDIPLPGALSPTPNPEGSVNGLVAILDPAAPQGSRVRYGSLITSAGYQIAVGTEVDPAGNVYVTGVTNGQVFPPGQAVQGNGAGNTDVYLLVFRP